MHPSHNFHPTSRQSTSPTLEQRRRDLGFLSYYTRECTRSLNLSYVRQARERYGPEKIVHGLGLMVRSGRRLAAARRREYSCKCRQIATATATATSTATATAALMSAAHAHSCAHTLPHPPRLKPVITLTANDSDALERSSPIPVTT
jgi:hypothetical protein